MSHEPHLHITTVDAGQADVHCDLPSGRQISIRTDAEREELVLVGRDGAVELQVILTDEGPVLRMPVARISLRGADQLDLSARQVRIRATEDMQLEAGGRIDLRSEADTAITAEGDVRVVGAVIHLN